MKIIVAIIFIKEWFTTKYIHGECKHSCMLCKYTKECWSNLWDELCEENKHKL